MSQKVLNTQDGPIHYWVLGYNMKKPKAVFLQFHGNAENMTSHSMNVGWLIEHGYQVFAFDYPGYGSTPGQASIESALKSSYAMMEHVQSVSQSLSVPYYFYGQSLGGSLLLKTLKDNPKDFSPQAVIVESSFYSYPDIAQEKMADFILLWPFQWMAQIFVTSRYDAGGEDLKKISHFNFLFIHSQKDPVVPFKNSQQFLESLDSNKAKLWSLPEPGHISMAFAKKGQYRAEFLKKLQILQTIQ